MTILLIILITAIFLVILGWPVWYLGRLYKANNAVSWILVPGILVIFFFCVSLLAEFQSWITVSHVSRILLYYLVSIHGLLFLVSLVGVIAKRLFRIPSRTLFWTLIVCTCVFTIGARIQGNRIVVTDITIPAEHITRAYQFVHISDLHHGSTTARYARRVVEKIQPLDPEFMVITGDFIDENFVTSAGIADFNRLDFPQYLITGNHEYYLEENKIQAVIAESGIKLIDNQRVVYEELDIIGINELATIDETLASIGSLDTNRYTIILDHQPKTDEAHRAASHAVDLMLSGHTHKGQVWPLGLLVRFQFKYLAGLYQIDEMALYVNQGTGTFGPAFRFGSVNEITLITLEPMGKIE